MPDWIPDQARNDEPNPHWIPDQARNDERSGRGMLIPPQITFLLKAQTVALKFRLNTIDRGR